MFQIEPNKIIIYYNQLTSNRVGGGIAVAEGILSLCSGDNAPSSDRSITLSFAVAYYLPR